MTIKILINTSISLPALALIIGAWLTPLAADSTIYRCGPEGSQWFSQIPCEENSRLVIVKDHPMFKETAVSGTDSAESSEIEESVAEEQADNASKVQAFITQLEKQRNEQISEIDRNIEELQSRAEETDAAGQPTGDAEEAARLLAGLQNTRQSIMSEYEAMISAARQRIETP